MKKKFLVVAMLIVVIMTAVLLAGCNTEKMQLGFMSSADGTPEYVNVNIKDYEGKMLSDLLKTETSLGAVIEDGMLNEIKGIKADFDNDQTYISIYTTNEADKVEGTIDWPAPEPIVINGVTYYQSGKGISQLAISKEIKYMFILEKMVW